ncbi:MAG: putative baseplate assembly protein [Verrucomicrobiales bacterium]|nr:putative baseplate assembly protein [Verrucomicrobiales bacterium]
MLKYFCCEERRRNAVKAHPSLNGIDFLEVFDPGNPNASDSAEVQALNQEFRQRRLFIRLLKEITPGDLSASNVLIEGGERIRDIDVIQVQVVDAELLPLPELASTSPSSPSAPASPGETVLMIDVSAAGDFSTYTLRLIHPEDRDKENPRPPTGFDPILSAVDFSFKVACPGDFDCESKQICSPAPRTEPEINYRAKDYASFRQLMLDRLAVIAPQWQERLAADMGMALVELLAYVADYLSYRQDAVATEAYLRTARLRTSVRRHSRLVDYRMHDGCNACVWVHLRVREDIAGLPLRIASNGQRTKILTRVQESGAVTEPIFNLDGQPYEDALNASPEIFEPLHEITLHADHNELRFHTWSELDCCLPAGAVRATLAGSYPHLQPGDVLIFQEVKGPKTGQAEDANPTHRHAVRLISVSVSEDPLGDETASPSEPIPVTEIEWDEEDALPFPLCISAPGVDNVSVAFGNNVLADHGLTVEAEELPPVPAFDPALSKVSSMLAGHCEETEVDLTPPRYRPRLQATPPEQFIGTRPLTYAPPFEWDAPPFEPDESPKSAAALFQRSAPAALPQVTLTEAGKSDIWEPVRDLLGSEPEAKEFVVETENDGSAFLRFGDDQFGSRPATGAQLTAHYRVGNGQAGNIGAGAIGHIASADPAIISDLANPVIEELTNPLAARGGVEPETLEEVRQNAPQAFRTQQRAVTLDDYVAMAHRCDPHLQSGAATSRWTGSWHTVFLTVDRLAGRTADAAYEESLRACLEKFRMAGHDLEVDLPRPVPLELEMHVCIHPGYFRNDVKSALLDRFSNRLLADGSKGVFHPDNFSLGQTVFLSPFYEAAQSVAGVASVEITRFQRQDNPTDEHLDSGKLELDRLEVARLDNDPNFPERGRFVLKLGGGK